MIDIVAFWCVCGAIAIVSVFAGYLGYRISEISKTIRAQHEVISTQVDRIGELQNDIYRLRDDMNLVESSLNDRLQDCSEANYARYVKLTQLYEALDARVRQFDVNFIAYRDKMDANFNDICDKINDIWKVKPYTRAEIAENTENVGDSEVAQTLDTGDPDGDEDFSAIDIRDEKVYKWVFPADDHVHRPHLGGKYLVIGFKEGLEYWDRFSLISCEATWDECGFSGFDERAGRNVRLRQIFAFIELPEASDVMKEVLETYFSGKD